MDVAQPSVWFDHRPGYAIMSADPTMLRTTGLVVLLLATALPATSGYVSVTTDSVPAEVYLDGTTIEMSSATSVVEATPGKHFVSLFPPRKVYEAMFEQAPEQFWDKLRSKGIVEDQPGLLSSYEAGAVRIGTQWVYVAPDETTSVRLSQSEVARTFRHDTGCVTSTFLGTVLLIGAAMIVSVFFTTLTP
jgi:phage terminase large subunit-like protein